jgi:parallel beta-helix repeat protein
VFVRKYGFPFQTTPANIEIRNCKAKNHRTGVFVGGGTNVYVHHNDLSNNLDTVDKARFGIFLGMTEGGGLRFDSVKGGRAEYNTANREAIGIDVRDSDRVSIRFNTANSNSAWGISLLNTSYSQVSNNTVKDNIRYCAWGDGTVGRGCDAGGIILQDGASHNTVSGNSVLGENGNGVFIKAHASRCGDYNLIDNNTITDAVYNAIEFSFCTGNRVIGNTITGSYDAIWFGFSNKTEVRGNSIKNMNNHGIISYNSRDSIIADNRVINSRDGIYFYWDTWDPKRFFFLTPTVDNYASRNNTIRDNYLGQNSVAGIHFLNSTDNQLINNSFADNGQNVLTESKGQSSSAGSGR